VETAKHKWAFSCLWPNVAVAVTAAVLVLANRISSAGELWRYLVYALAYANVVALLAVLVFGVLAKAPPVRKLSLAPVFAVCIFVLVPVGCLLVHALLLAAGVVTPDRFWEEYFVSLRLTLPPAVLFGLGALTHASLRERLAATERRLHEKEVAEERALKLAAEARLRSLESRIHPHFLFNTLNSISALIVSDPARAERIVGRLAALLRSSLETGDRRLIPLREELTIVESYLEIEVARFGDKLRRSLEAPAGLMDAGVPPMSVQALVENAVKHGIAARAAGGEVRVTARAEHGSIRIEVRDSGPGFDLGSIPAGHGLDNLVERLEALFGEQARLNAVRRDGESVVEMVLPRT
jgi:LytS/YehU family sensor histidine kinase